ncbi:MFS transporter [Streptosporangium canum]|uniref:MFS transporter n=1 Tax=Streptosporangium canum TaxID=324952 RepID=UPI0036A70446
MRRRLAEAAELLRTNAPFRRYALARLSSTVGTTVAPLGLSFSVLQLGGGPGELSVVLMANLLVFLALTPVAGVIADRVPRLMVIVGCQVASAVIQGVAAALVMTGTATPALLAGTAVLTGAAGACIQPASKGLLPQLVESRAMVNANALLQIASNMIAVVGPVLAGLVIAASGPGVILAWDGVSFVVSAAVFLTLRLPSSPRPQQRQRFLADLTEGWGAFASRRWLWIITGLGTLTSGCWAACIEVLGPVYATQQMNGAVSWGIVSAALGVGLAVGSVAALLLRPVRVGLVVCVAAVPPGALLAAMAAAAPLALIAVAAVATGAAGTMKLITWSSFLQAGVIPEAQLSRVLALNAMMGALLVPVAYAMVGPVAEAVGVRPVLWACAILVIGGAVAAACVGEVRRLTAAEGEVRAERSSSAALTDGGEAI